MNKEIWKDVPGYEGLYQVSNFCNVKGYKGIMKPYKNRYGYYRVCLCKDNKKYYVGIHRLVCLAFIPNQENKPQVNHIDFIRTNNSVSNLEWCTPKENTQHTFKHGRMKNIYHKMEDAYCLKHPERLVIYYPKLQCKPCYMSEYRIKNKERFRERRNELARIWRSNNHEKYKAILRKSYWKRKLST